ncbi:hypothetical protein BX600DRAFT_431770 [Xylariales sp. PMI_506]|nr:hypothetical protein BX600DRAFT_431770 [Xylariales sp. PMI_506]
MGQQDPQQSRLMSTCDAPASYKRIRIANEKDIEMTYPLIAHYVQKPELAFTVDEFVADEDTKPPGSRCDFWEGKVDPRFKKPPREVSEGAYSAIEAYIQGLRLGKKTTQSMLKSLDWKKRQLKGEIPESPNRYDGHNWEYASTAIVVLMSLCKNITNLYLGGVGYGTPLEDYLLKSNYEVIPRPGLQRVKRVEIIPSAPRAWDERVYEDVELLDYFMFFHRLPLLEAVAMDGLAEYQANRGVFPPGVSPIKKLRIEHTDMSSTMMSTILRIPKALEEIHVQEGGLWSVDGGYPSIQPDTLGKALLDHKETLRVLELDVGGGLLSTTSGAPKGMGYEMKDSDEDFDEMAMTEEEYNADERDKYYHLDEIASQRPLLAYRLKSTRKYGYTMGSLHDFTALTRLSIHFRLLFGPGREGSIPDHLAEAQPARLVDMLPPNLEYFCLYNYERGENIDIDNLVDEFMHKKTERFPRLQIIRGINETVMSERALYTEDDREDNLWRRPEVDLGWVKADSL